MLNTTNAADTGRRAPTRARRSDFLTVAEAAELASVEGATMRVWCATGAVKAVRVVGRWRVDAADLNELLHGRPSPTR